MRRLLAIPFFLGLPLIIASCGTFGSNPSAPSATEQQFFNTVTNYVQVPVIVLQTNLTTVTLTNTVTILQTNSLGQIGIVTQQVAVPIIVPQILTVTNYATQTNYTLTPNTTTTSIATTAGSVANLVVPGGGGIVTLGITLLAGIYGYLRSYKNGKTGNALSQEMETVLEFIKALPNGDTYKTALTDFLAKHQADVGVVSQVTSILANDVSNPDAKVAAEQVVQAINALQVAAAPGAPSAPAATATAATPVLKVASVSLATPPKVG